MRALLLFVLLLLAPLAAKETELFINGVKADAVPVTDLGTVYYPVAPIATALGVKAAFNGSYVSFNGQQLNTPPLVIKGEPYLALDVIASTLGATVERDPVRGLVHLRGAALSNTPGIPTYTADYKTPEQEEREKRNQMYKNAGIPGEIMLEEKEEELKKQFPKTVKALDRNKPDITPNWPSHPWISSGGDDPVPDGSANSPPENTGPKYASAGFAHRSGDNGTYKLTVTDVKIAEALRGMNPPQVPKPGYRFIVVFVTQENLTKARVSPVWFAVRDVAGNLYPAEEAISQFSMGTLNTRETTSGYVVAQIPQQAVPVAVELICSPAVSVGLSPQP